MKPLELVFIFHKQFYYVVSGLKIVGYGNPDNSFESSCTYEVCETCSVLVSKLGGEEASWKT
jgi:succinate dehydrogenase/fumarate reductase-like Fe-S protein